MQASPGYRRYQAQRDPVSRYRWYLRYCIVCSTEWNTRNPEARFCSLDCRDFEARQRYLPVPFGGPATMTPLPDRHPARWFRPNTPRVFVEGPCGWCGDRFTIVDQMQARYCSDRCGKRAARAARGKRFIVPPHTRLAIYERDGWRCQLCRKRVGKKFPSTHRRAPTLDHIVPRSLGGSDEPSNLQLAHRICNSMKIAEVWGAGEQMMLMSEV